MSKIKIVIDTNIIYSGLYSSAGASFRILKLMRAGKITPVLSTTLIFEYEEVLKRNKDILSLSEEEIDLFIDNICNFSEKQKIYYLWRPYLRDPKDDHILELAVASKIKYIVTYNIKDFKGSDKFGIDIIKPNELLEIILWVL